jgi:hypothetical protein
MEGKCFRLPNRRICMRFYSPRSAAYIIDCSTAIPAESFHDPPARCPSNKEVGMKRRNGGPYCAWSLSIPTSEVLTFSFRTWFRLKLARESYSSSVSTCRVIQGQAPLKLLWKRPIFSRLIVPTRRAVYRRSFTSEFAIPSLEFDSRDSKHLAILMFSFSLRLQNWAIFLLDHPLGGEFGVPKM